MTALEIVPYDPRWPAQFEAEATRIHEALGPLAVRVDHHGSTAVPGLAAKPVIDILLHPLIGATITARSHAAVLTAHPIGIGVDAI